MDNNSLEPLQRYLDRLIRQVEFLPRLRDGLLELAAELDRVLGKDDAPKRTKAKRGPHKYLDRIPTGSRKIPGVSNLYHFVVGFGMVKKTPKGFLAMKNPGNGCWNVEALNGGKRFQLSRGTLKKLLKVDDLGIPPVPPR